MVSFEGDVLLVIEIAHQAHPVMEPLAGTRPVAYQVVDVGIETNTIAIGSDTVSQHILEDLVLLII